MAIGDSWVSVWWQPSLIGSLTALGYQTVKRVSSLGRRLAEMARDDNLAAVTAYLRDLEPGTGPKAIVLGGGGNDVVYPSSEPIKTPLFAMLKPGAGNADDALVEGEVAQFIDQDLFGHYQKIVGAIRDASDIPIFIHAYDHPVPDHRAQFPEMNFLLPVFNARGIPDVVGRQVMKRLIDRLDQMVGRLAATYPDGKVVHVSLCGTLAKQGGDYTEVWRNDLHPERLGFDLLAEVLVKAMATKLAELGINPA
jgi:hypothetical protein